MYPAIGHFNASFVLNELLSRQHRIVYCVESEYEKIITDKRFECIIIDYPLESDKKELQKKEYFYHRMFKLCIFTKQEEYFL